VTARKPIHGRPRVRLARARIGRPLTQTRGRAWRPVVRGALAAAPSPVSTDTVLIVDGDGGTRRLGAQLMSLGLGVVEVHLMAEVEQRVFEAAPAVILLDLDRQPSDGLELLRRLRGWSDTPVIALSSRGVEDDKVAALDAGADDHVTTPIGNAELAARVRSALRRVRAPLPRPPAIEGGDPVIVVGPLRIDPSAQEATLAGKPLTLTRMELRLLIALAHNAGRVLTSHQISLAVWGPSSENQVRSVRGYIARIRHLLEADPAHPRWLVTKQRVGYCLRKLPDLS
jgi:two-component system, OmpR family, KDP operon response regulator KdpE